MRRWGGCLGVYTAMRRRWVSFSIPFLVCKYSLSVAFVEKGVLVGVYRLLVFPVFEVDLYQPVPRVGVTLGLDLLVHTSFV
jgi:hypothetical protein